MTIQDIMFSEEDWGNFWVYFRGEPQQLDGIELLRKAIADVDPALLTDSAEWVANVAMFMAPHLSTHRL